MDKKTWCLMVCILGTVGFVSTATAKEGMHSIIIEDTKLDMEGAVHECVKRINWTHNAPEKHGEVTVTKQEDGTWKCVSNIKHLEKYLEENRQ